jgi:hypothetical protein
LKVRLARAQRALHQHLAGLADEFAVTGFRWGGPCESNGCALALGFQIAYEFGNLSRGRQRGARDAAAGAPNPESRDQQESEDLPAALERVRDRYGHEDSKLKSYQVGKF